MGCNARAEIRYGYPCAEDAELPWGEDIEGWWREINGYKPPFELYTDEGEYIGGKKPNENLIDKYYEHQHKWEEENPLPVMLCFTGSHDYPQTFIALPDAGSETEWGHFLNINDDCMAQKPDRHEVLEKFISDYEIETDGEPGWYLFAFYG